MPYIPNTDRDREEMLKRIGVSSFEELISEIPDEIRLRTSLDLPSPLTEMEVKKELQKVANESTINPITFMGGGAYDHYIPTVVDQMILRSEFATAYTPYQPEVSQGTLQQIYEYQTMISELTGMEVANASLYDGASALAEACNMAKASTRRTKILMAETIHPHHRQVVKTYCKGLGLELIEIPMKDGRVHLDLTDPPTGPLRQSESEARRAGKNVCPTEDTAALLIQQPNFFGCLEDIEEMEKAIHRVGGLFVVSVDPISLGLLKPPGEYGADIVVGEGQPLGIPLSFGGPYLGLFATRKKFIRQIPGRIVGRTVDNQGIRGYVLTLQTREQHIRRERATSNICTNQALCALAATVYLSLLGKRGIREVSRLCLEKSHYLAGELSKLDGFRLAFSHPYFKEFTLECEKNPKDIIHNLLNEGIFAGVDLGRFDPKWEKYLLIAVTEKRTREEMDKFVESVKNL
jgi:glycine dehydrogenase subunit 1